MDFGLLLIRVLVGGLVAGHGLQKLLGWWGGPGIEGTTGMMGHLRYHPPRPFAYLAAATEVIGGLFVGLGLLMPLACAAVIGQMVNAIWAVHKPNGLWVTKSGYEYPLVLATVAAGLAFTTAGAWSIDYVGGNDFGNPIWGVIAIGIGIAAGAVALNMRHVEPEPLELGGGRSDVATTEDAEVRRTS